MTDDGLRRVLPGRTVVGRDAAMVAEMAAAWVVQHAQRALRARGAFAIALSGGHTPRLLHARLAAPPHRDEAGFESWTVLYGDERAVPPDDAASNHRLAVETLLSQVPIPSEQVHRMPADAPDLDAASAGYAALLERLLPAGPGGAPRIDCVILGLGEDGHTASLFPGTAALEVRDRWVTRGLAPVDPHDRMTVTFPVLTATAAVAFLVNGAGKRAALDLVRAGRAPAARVDPRDGDLVWFLDRDAAGEA